MSLQEKIPGAGKLGSLTKHIPLPDITKFFTQLTEAYKEQKLTEREVAKINAQKEIILAEITARHETYRLIFDRIFAERKEVIDRLFDTIDHAVVAQDTQLVLGSLEGLSRIVSSSPFKNAGELSRLLESGNAIEI